MCSSTVAIVAPQKQRHAADLWDSRFNWRRSAGTMTARKSRIRQRPEKRPQFGGRAEAVAGAVVLGGTSTIRRLPR
jgi:hypothetical protein